jgi:methylglutaconyl-CoA hydratase
MSELSELSVAHFGSPEGREGVLAYREKRPPNWLPRP